MVYTETYPPLAALWYMCCLVGGGCMDHQLPTPVHHTPAVGDAEGWKSQILHHKPTYWLLLHNL